MKVTVCFGNVRVVVPCGNGDLLVRDLVQSAVIRYKKATGKATESWVNVHNLKSFSDGGILDPDDKLRDVADDREQLFAAFEEQGGSYPLVPHSDGISTASSLGTESPEFFHTARTESRCSLQNDVEINCDTIPADFAPLHVRRGSEPALNRISPIPILISDPMKRWSAAVFADEDLGPDVSTPKERSVEKLCEEEETYQEYSQKPNGGLHPAFQRFSSETGRLSILGNNAETYRWVEAADRQLYKYQSQESLETTTKDKNSSKTTHVVLRNEGGPLGIHVVPDYNETGKDMGLVVQGIEPGGRIDRDGRLQVQDRIVEINGQCLLHVSFQRAQEVFKEALRKPEISLRVLKDENDGRVGPKTAIVIPTKKSVVAAAARPAGTLLAANTRKIGKKIHIQLTKGSEGLGFSVTTRDNPAGGNCPIYIKNILPKGAAIRDGRLNPGDRLLEVNGMEMTGKTQAEAVTVLRNTPLGGVVKLVVSRQESDSPKLPREMTDKNKLEKIKLATQESEDGNGSLGKHKDIVTLVIPLNDTESAGLGVSVKGKTSTGPKGTTDLGIFVKSVITGGAASKDGRLQENDQLLSVNDVPLAGTSNSLAMEALRRAIQQEGPNPNAITLVIGRKKTQHSIKQDVHDGYGMTNETDSATSEYSDGTSLVISHPWSMTRENDESRNNFDQEDRTLRKIEDKDLGLDVPLRNPVVDRITGQRHAAKTASASLRNESYYRATHDISFENRPHHRSVTAAPSPTVNLILDNSVIIEDDYSAPRQIREAMPEQKSLDTSMKKNLQNSNSDITCISQLSLDEITKNFSRDGFGRQSMSEKRHAHLDAKNTDTYQRNKKAKEEKDKHKEQHMNQAEFRANSADSLLNVVRVKDTSKKKAPEKQFGPVLGMKKSSSLESLQTMVAEVASDAMDGENFARPSVKAVKNRGCNESFRAAVDRSYEASPGSLAEGMETLEEESESGSSGMGRGGNALQTAVPGDFGADDPFRYGKKGAKKKSLFKGLGSVFKFGKQKKTSDDQLPRLTIHDLERQKAEAEKIHARKAAQEEQERIQEHYRKLLQRQTEMKNGPSEQEQNRQQWMSQLRAQHQRKHQERQGQYPCDGTEAETSDHHYSTNVMDKQCHKPRYLRKDPTRYSFQVLPIDFPLHRRAHSQIHPQRYESEVVHSRSHSYDVYKEIERPGSRKGFADPNKFSHYVNYEEIQHHLSQQKQKAPFYLNQNQRDNQRDHHPDIHPRLQPSTNYYEYETIKTPPYKSSRGETSANSLPRKSTVIKVPAQPSSSGGRSRPDYYTYSSHRREQLPVSRYGKEQTHNIQAQNRQPGPPYVSKYHISNHRKESNNPGSKV